MGTRLLVAICSISLLTPATSGAQSLVAAILPSSRSVQVGTPATVFATIINAGPGIATSCGISPVTHLAATFSFQTTDPATNAPTGAPDTPVDILPGVAQSFVLVLTPTAPIASTDVELSFDCTNTEPAPMTRGLNTLLLSSESQPIPDIVAMAATLANDGIVGIPVSTGAAAFAVAVSNVGAGSSLQVSADTGELALALALELCETNPATSVCTTPSVADLPTTIGAGATATFALFVRGTSAIPFDPSLNRIFVRFRDGGGVVRGATSVAVHAPATLPPLTANLAPRLRGATLGEWGDWSDPQYRGWENIDEFPQWGGNVLSLIFGAFRYGQPVLPGQPLADRVMAVLDKYSAVIDWALQHNVYVNLRFIQVSHYPRTPFRIWPDDGRLLWTDASAQDELVQAWAQLARRFKGKQGILFNLLTEPNPWTDAVPQVLVYQAWNTLYPRVIDAIRAEDPERWIVVEPLYGDARNFAASSLGLGFPDLTVSKDPRVMYEFHFYEPHFFTCQGCSALYPPAESIPYPGWTTDAPWEPEQFWDKSALEQRLLPAVAFREAHNVRVMAGEFGSSYLSPMDSRVRWTADVVDLLESHGFDWAYFTYDAMNWADLDDFGPWDFESTPLEPLVTSKFVLNLR